MVSKAERLEEHLDNVDGCFYNIWEDIYPYYDTEEECLEHMRKQLRGLRVEINELLDVIGE